MRDKVFIEGLRLSGTHGVVESEWTHEQDFVLDILATCDVSRAIDSDNIADTLDYRNFVAIAEKIIGGPTNYLIERLAGRIVEALLEDDRVHEVTVTIRKPQVFSNGMPGVSVTRGRH